MPTESGSLFPGQSLGAGTIGAKDAIAGGCAVINSSPRVNPRYGREKGASILLIDDDPVALRAIEIALVGLGYDVATASDGESGLEHFRSCAPDLVITDIMMPGKDGIEIITEIRRLPTSGRIIAISGYGTPEKHCLLTMALALGADYVLAKPFGRRQLAELIEAALEQNRSPNRTSCAGETRQG